MNVSKLGEDSGLHSNKFHNFMIYEAIQRIFSAKEFDSKMTSLMEKDHFGQEKNPLFLCSTPTISLEVALKMASNWRDMMKQYMFTLLISLGKLADNVSQLDLPSHYTVNALQTGITILADELNTTFLPSEEKPDALRYGWWEKNILGPLRAASPEKSLTAEIAVAPKAQVLLQCMNKLAKNPFGFAVQLRVVECIALDTVLFLLTLFSKIDVHGQKIFKQSDVWSWITAHIEDEISSDQQANDEDHRIMNLIGVAQQEDLFLLAEEYINCWRAALDELYGFIHTESKTDDCKGACHLL